MSHVVLEDAQTRVGSSVTQDMIDEAEGWLVQRFGPLTGARTETFHLSERSLPWRPIDGLWLSRHTDSVEFVNDGSELVAGTDFRLVDGLLLERITNGVTWGRTVAVTYTPNDEAGVARAVFDLLTYAQLPSGVQSVRIGDYSETYFPPGIQTEAELARILSHVLPAARMGIFAHPYRYADTRRDRTVIEVVSGS